MCEHEVVPMESKAFNNSRRTFSNAREAQPVRAITLISTAGKAV